jgi:hypothetical protein
MQHKPEHGSARPAAQPLPKLPTGNTALKEDPLAEAMKPPRRRLSEQSASELLTAKRRPSNTSEELITKEVEETTSRDAGHRQTTS